MVANPMGLARAFTRKMKRQSSTAEPMPTRSATVKINRDMISLPTELISTTNVNALNAPDIRPIHTSSGSSVNSSKGSDSELLDCSFLDTPTLSPDTSSIDSSPTTPTTPELGGGRGFFERSLKRAATTASPRISGSVPTLEAPILPKRSSSHSKKAHIELSRKKSLQRMTPPPIVVVQPGSGRNSPEFFGFAGDLQHPFHQELAQVNEVAEEFGITSPMWATEEQEMQSRGLKKFGVQDYLEEIAGLYGGVFEGHLGPLARPVA